VAAEYLGRSPHRARVLRLTLELGMGRRAPRLREIMKHGARYSHSGGWRSCRKTTPTVAHAFDVSFAELDEKQFPDTPLVLNANFRQRAIVNHDVHEIFASSPRSLVYVNYRKCYRSKGMSNKSINLVVLDHRTFEELRTHSSSSSGATQRQAPFDSIQRPRASHRWEKDFV